MELTQDQFKEKVGMCKRQLHNPAFLYVRKWLNDRLITDDLIDLFDIGYGQFFGRRWITIPVKSMTGEYLFIKLRKDPTDEKNENKFMFYPTGSKGTIFGTEDLLNNDTLAVCLSKNSNVTTRDGIKKIDKISTNDYVYTHRGRYNKVKKIFNRNYKGDMFSIKPKYTQFGIEATSEHPIYVCDINKCSCKSWEISCHPDCKRKNRYKTLKCQENFKPIWKDAKDVKSSDFLVYPINRSSKIHINIKKNISRKMYRDENFWYFVGLFIGDGTINRRKKNIPTSVTIYGDVSAKLHIKDFVLRFIKETGRDAKSRDVGSCWRISLYMSSVARFLDMFYDGDRVKILPSWIETLPKKYQTSIIKGIYHADGNIHKNKNGNDIRISNTSFKLLESIQRILLRFDILVSVEKGRSGGKYSIEGRTGNCKKLYNLRGDYSLAKLLGENIKIKTRKHKMYFIINDNVFLPIDYIKKENYSGKVYNISVDKDESYCSNLIVTHNCEGEFDRMLLFANGIPAITSTLGAAGFKKEWIFAFKNCKKVYIIFDKDAAGAKGAQRLGELILEEHPNMRVFQCILPDEVGEHGDVTDYFLKCSGNIDELLYDRSFPIIPKVKEAKVARTYSGETLNGEISDSDIANAKQTDCKEFVNIVRSSYDTSWAHCPFGGGDHDQGNPSLCCYKGEKGFYSYCCGKGGDSIDLVMELNDLSFIDAVKFILKK